MNAGRQRPESRTSRAGPQTPQVIRHLGTTVAAAAVLATLLTAWSPAEFQAGVVGAFSFGADGEATSGPTAVPENTPDQQGLRIGIVAGHLGTHPESGFTDPGAVCPDGLTELDVNQSIAELVVRGLEAAGFQVDLLQEWDGRLSGYRAVALVSIHADACVWINDQATGYKVAAALDSAVPDRSQRLVACLVDRYERATGLPFHAGSITLDMTEYHSFREIDRQTPAAIIETGFLYLDRDFLTQRPESAARGIVEGVLCYVNNEPASLDGGGQP